MLTRVRPRCSAGNVERDARCPLQRTSRYLWRRSHPALRTSRLKGSRRPRRASRPSLMSPRAHAATESCVPAPLRQFHRSGGSAGRNGWRYHGAREAAGRAVGLLNALLCHQAGFRRTRRTTRGRGLPDVSQVRSPTTRRGSRRARGRVPGGSVRKGPHGDCTAGVKPAY
jgi:hypothetical protein